MATTNLVVGIAAEYKGKPAFDKANKDVFGLQKGVKQLAKAYIGLAGAQKAFRYAKQSVQAFAADDKAAQQLARTVANLGLAYEQTNVENFIAGLEKTYHVADDFLRPAFSKLVSTTQSYTKSKELLTLALNASAGAGVDLSTTVNDLTQAYVGNTRGLNKYKLGLTKAELAGKSFDELQQIIAKRFKGQASLAAETYAGKIDALNIAAGNAKETIGRGLVDALQNITGKDQGIKDATNAIDNMAASTQLAIIEVSKLIGKLTQPALGALLQAKGKAASGKSNPLFDFLYGKAPGVGVGGAYNPMSGKVPDLTPQGIKNIKARAKADKDALKRQKEIALEIKKQNAALKEQERLKKIAKLLDQTNKLFDMDLIQNVAALQGKLTENEILRLKTQQAILLENGDAAAKLGQELLAVQLAAVMASSVDPFGKFTDSAKAAMDAIKAVIAELEKLGTSAATSGKLLLAKDYVAALKDAQDMSFQITQEETNAALAGLSALKDLPSISSLVPTVSPFTPSTGNFTYGQGNPLNVKVFVDPSAMAYGISAAVVDNSSNGNSNTYRTIQSFAGGM